MYTEFDFPLLGTSVKATVSVPGQTRGEEVRAGLRGVFADADLRFNDQRTDSEVSRIRRGEVAEHEASAEMQRVLDRCRLVNAMTDGAFSVRTPQGELDVAGVAKGWALKRASEWLDESGHADWRLVAEGDVLTSGVGPEGDWQVRISGREAVETLVSLNGHALATTGSASGVIRSSRGATPYVEGAATIVGPCIDIADALATGSWALGQHAISVMDRVPEYHLMMVTDEGVAFSHGFPRDSLATA